MASNGTLQAIEDQGRLAGFRNLFGREMQRWWGTRQWLVQLLIWMAIVNGMVAMVALVAPRMQQSGGSVPGAQELGQVALMIFFVFCGMAPAVGVVILGQDAIIQGRQSGTTPWLLSKPVGRPALILSRLSADALGVLAVMVAAQGVVFYLIYRAAIQTALSLGGLAAALGLVYLLLLFYLALTVMLGTLFHSRGPVIGIPMLLIFGNQLSGLAPALGKVQPWNLVMDLGATRPSLAIALVQGQPLPTASPIVGTAVLSVLFVALALWRFEREEF